MMALDSIIQNLDLKKQEANALFKAGKLPEARDLYFSTLIGCEELSSQSEPVVDEIRLACLNNLSALFNQCQQYSESIKLCQKALEIDSRNVKALFRKAQALDKLSRGEDALDTISQLLSLEPTNAQALKFYSDLTCKMAPTSREEDTLISKSPEEQKSSDQAITQPEETSTVSASMLARSSHSSDYGFMNPNWTPVSAEAAPVELSSDTTAALAESEKIRIKNELFAAALKHKFTESVEQTSANSSQKECSKTATLVVGEEVVRSLQALSVEEEQVVQQLNVKGNTLKFVGSKVKAKGVGGDFSKDKSLASKKVISDRARNEWAALMSDEDDIKKKAAAKLASLNQTAS